MSGQRKLKRSARPRLITGDQHMNLFVLIFSLVCLAVLVRAQSSEEDAIRVSGRVSLETFPGRPNYESVEDGDEAERAWILTVASGEKEIKFQLVVMDGDEQKFAALRRCIGKWVVIAGSVWDGNTGHHHAPLLITLRTIDEGALVASDRNCSAK